MGRARRLAGPLILAIAIAVSGGASASARTSAGGARGHWVAGELLIRFHDGIGPAQRSRLARAAHVTLGDELPVVPNLWEAFTRGHVPDAVDALDGERDVDYAQPDYFVNFTPDAGPGDAAYWPNDPYFWPAQFDNPNGCVADFPSTTTRLSGWPYWPLGINLTDSNARIGTVNPFDFSPLEAGIGAQMAGGNAAFANYRSIDVLPVWNLLQDQDRLGPPKPNRRWTTAGIQHFGVAVMDTGISNHPDVLPEVAAEFSAVRLTAQGERRDELTEFYSDDPHRDDIAQVAALINRQARGVNRALSITDPTRRLFPLDDTNSLSPTAWSPTQDGIAGLPTGCDGHGTGVASVIGARADNGVGTAGVGYDVPLIGLRPGMPWDTPPGSANAVADNQQAALQSWRNWKPNARDDDASTIDQLAVVEALQIPVLNMSFGTAMITQGTANDGSAHPVIRDGALAEAFARTLSTGKTLGVTAAGNQSEQYGTGPTGIGHGAIQLPCGLGVAPKLGLWTSLNSRAPQVRAREPWTPDINWKRIQLLCVAATTSYNSLWPHSGSGNSAVQLAAPGANITVATRAGADPAVSSYTNVNGTSFAAPMVAGAASLLRRAAPGAPITAIRAALLNGARPNAALTQSVSYGSLDVACSLRWLYLRRQPGWSMLQIERKADPAGYADYAQQTDGCNKPPETVISPVLEVAKSDLYQQARREDSLSEAMAQGLGLQQAATSNSNKWSQLLATASGAAPLNYRPAFAIRRAAFGKPVNPASVVGPVYRLGVVSDGCPTDGYVITGVSVYFSNLVKPPGWVIPTDAVAPPKALDLAVVVSKPGYHGFVGSPLKFRLSVRCEYYPRATQ